MNDKARRFAPRFSLRAFLIVVTVSAVWLGMHTRRARQQKAAVQTITDYGGWVRYDYQFVDGDFDGQAKSWVPQQVHEWLGIDMFHSVAEVNLSYSSDTGKRIDNENRSQAPLECLSSMPRLRRLYFQETQASDSNMKYVGQLKHLEHIMIWDAVNITDKGAAELRNCTKLERIYISESKLTDESLRMFSELPNLTSLSLQFSNFSNAGVRYVRNLKQLETLAVCGIDGRPSEITDDSLEFLLELPNFVLLGVQNTNVSPEFETRMKAKFPACTVWR